MIGEELPTAEAAALQRPVSLARLGAEILKPLGAPGVYARTAAYTRVVDALEGYLSTLRDPHAEIMRFPPVMSRAQLEKSGYLSSFPHLLGCVCALHGSETEIRQAADRVSTAGSWTDALAPTDLVLLPAACYPLYPLAAARGAIPADGWSFDVEADCFRREPSDDIDRLQSFRMREYVKIGSAAQVMAFRDGYLAQAPLIAQGLGLPYSIETANDPFFGRIGRIKAVSQRQQALKFELLIPFAPGAKPTACMSFNYHRDHFGSAWGMSDEAAQPAHTGCVAFGIDRLTIALFAIHGLDFERWPPRARRTLSL